MKKILVVLLIALCVLCSCKAAEKMPEMGDIYGVNNHESVIEGHKSYIAVTEYRISGSIWTNYYRKGSPYSLHYGYNADDSAASATVFGDDLYFCCVTTPTLSGTYDYIGYIGGELETGNEYFGFWSEPEEGEEKIVACEATENGYTVSVSNGNDSRTEILAEKLGREYCDGDGVIYELKLTEAYEITEYTEFFIPADGGERIEYSHTSVEYDSDEYPDYFDEAVAAYEKGSDGRVTVVSESGVIAERAVYGDAVIFDTDCDVYSDAEFTEKIEPIKVFDDCFRYKIDGETTVYVKERNAAE